LGVLPLILRRVHVWLLLYIKKQRERWVEETGKVGDGKRKSGSKTAGEK
jgi:hypothetical protein